MISLVMPTRNRARTIGRAIASVLAQSHGDWELVIVDGASTDETRDMVSAFGDERVRFISEDVDDGVTAGRNRGLDESRGEWIGMLDSDDELVPNALETLLAQLDRISPRLDAISCNCIDGASGRFTGRGLERDRFLTVPLSLERARGEHWGIFRRRLLGRARFDPRIRGFEGHLWMRIHDGALWYYVHRGLRVYHRDGGDRNSERANIDYELHRQIFDHDPDLLRRYARWSRRAFVRHVRIAAFEFLRAGDIAHLELAVRALRDGGAPILARAFQVGGALRSMT